MKLTGTLYLFILTFILVIYYLVCGIYLNRIGYYNHESLFYIEKTKIVFEGLGNRLKVMGLTSPILPFYVSFIFSPFKTLAPVLASALGTAALFYVIASTVAKRLNDDGYIWLLLIIFLFHPGIIYTASSGKSIYLILIFFFLFFLNLFKFYKSNTTFHVSIASICLVGLIFCDYKFIWLTLFFLPLVLSITIHSLNLGEQESIFRLFLSFNSPSLRRKLANKTFALYIILFSLPLAAVLCYKLLNLTHANDLNYFNESPYATWNVLVDKLSFDQLTTDTAYRIPETSILLSAQVLLFAPMILIAIYLFRESTYQVLTLLIPFAFIEFLHIKYSKVFLAYQYYLIFLILAFLGVIFKAHTVKKQKGFKLLLLVTVLFQLYVGWYYLKTSSIAEEKNFASVLVNRHVDDVYKDNIDVASYLNSLPGDAHVLIDDAIGYGVIAFTQDIKPVIMPYQGSFLSALESPDKYVDYIVVATAKNVVSGYTQLNNKYILTIRKTIPDVNFRKVFETDDWTVYRVITNETGNSRF
ncbi:hypothetical protein [Mucilaginibacter phyllosphaerae]|uniref:Glycosyltransferase RgtA/B/C/D-like domain-containing protein n=1 Tax=Mucilaginibacter phyllosphaerae TaxID=1812349 RepID=A0A4Y8AA84_9SPHI|nr:hypothetical protein [Mucilaginibacter phyllosphaerae]MBB3970006.1 hypothetical protein [Mucilaginibacter phyllosphaerae]TEW65374.1 hypothetical protein E2R65_15810 [Mucilaginibacter phyllosphaerae]GGH16296.1 hypothetical protein GCM10007352_25590 [Mucilaginibacter phyllosphaerae]